MSRKNLPSSRKSIYLTDMEWAIIEKISDERNCSINAFFRNLLEQYIFMREFQDNANGRKEAVTLIFELQERRALGEATVLKLKEKILDSLTATLATTDNLGYYS